MDNNTPLKIIGVFGGLAYLAHIMDQVADDQEAALERAISDQRSARPWESSPGIPRKVFDPEACPGCGFYSCQCDDASAECQEEVRDSPQ